MTIKDLKNSYSNSVYFNKIKYIIDFQVFKTKNIEDIYAIAYMNTLSFNPRLEINN